MKSPFCYEELIRVPTLVRWPKALAGGQILSGLFSLADIAPTCLAAAGVSIPSDMDGIDASPLLRGDVEKLRQDVLVEFVDNPGKLRGKTIISPTHKLTWYAGQPYGELYDLVDDPAEKVNRWRDPADAAVKSVLLGWLLDYQETLEKRSDRLVYA